MSLVLVLVTTLLVSCSSPEVQIPVTYSPEKIAQLQVYAEPIAAARQTLETIPKLITDKNWVDTITLIHGPLGLLRAQMLGLSRSLLAKDQEASADLAKDVFGHLEQLDEAAKLRDVSAANYHYSRAIKSFDAFSNMIPSAS
ncbi:MAG: photosystem II protein PsbQ [Microcystaceae cyanobacterium]